MVRYRLGGWIAAVALLAAGCAAPASPRPAASEQPDVWFMQHMVPHLRQTTAIVRLARERGTRPELVRLAGTIDRQAQAHLQQLQGLLDRRGLAAHGHSHSERPSRPEETDLARLSRVPAGEFDVLFLQVMTTRHRAGSRLAAAELRHGSLPEVRQEAGLLLAQHRVQIATMTAWRAAWVGVST